MPLTNSSADSAAVGKPPVLAVLDSGAGGLPYLSWIHRHRPQGRYIYLADSKGFPYGSKSEEELIELVRRRIGCIQSEFDPDMVLIACNTASVVALAALREKFPLPFVGVVPAVKPAALKSKARRIGLIATSETVVSSYTDKLIADFASDCSVVRYAGQGLVEFVEHRITGSTLQQRLDAVTPACSFFRDAGVDQLVLGCTHFIHLKDEFQELLGPDIEVVDSVEGVGREVLRRLEELSAGNRPEGEGDFRIYTTSMPENGSYTDFAHFYGASFEGVLSCP